MTGMERIAARFAAAGERMLLMTHLVGGYPDPESSEELLRLMCRRGSGIVEVQLPFSDPPADGPVIVAANHAALQQGMTTGRVLEMMARVRRDYDTPLLVMSYLNPLLAYGVERLCDELQQNGIDGLIVPDYPPDESYPPLAEEASRRGLALVPLIAPSADTARIRLLTERFQSPFVYAVLRLGVTGRETVTDLPLQERLAMVRRGSGLPVAGGFGLSSPEQLQALHGHLACAVVGSGMLRAVNSALEAGRDPLEAADTLLGALLDAC